MPTQRKQKHFLTRAERAAMKDEVRIAIEYPYRSHARGSAVAEIATRYNVSKSVVWEMINGTRRTHGSHAAAPAKPAKPAPTPAALAIPNAAPAKIVETTYELTVGDVTISASSKRALLGVLDRLLVAREG